MLVSTPGFPPFFPFLPYLWRGPAGGTVAAQRSRKTVDAGVVRSPLSQGAEAIQRWFGARGRSRRKPPSRWLRLPRWKPAPARFPGDACFHCSRYRRYQPRKDGGRRCRLMRTADCTCPALALHSRSSGRCPQAGTMETCPGLGLDPAAGRAPCRLARGSWAMVQSPSRLPVRLRTCLHPQWRRSLVYVREASRPIKGRDSAPSSSPPAIQKREDRLPPLAADKDKDMAPWLSAPRRDAIPPDAHTPPPLEKINNGPPRCLSAHLSNYTERACGGQRLPGRRPPFTGKSTCKPRRTPGHRSIVQRPLGLQPTELLHLEIDAAVARLELFLTSSTCYTDHGALM
jgi:hypothetical protein